MVTTPNDYQVWRNEGVKMVANIHSRILYMYKDK